MITFPANGRETAGYLAVPPSGTGPGVVVLQEWWGLVDHIKGVADRFAREGFVALAPDLYHGETAKAPDEAGKLMMALNIDEAEKDLRGAIRALQSEGRASGSKVGVVGFCMGGALSLYAASKNPEVAACVVFYGIHPNVKPDLPNLQAAVLGLYAEKDSNVPPEAVRALESQLQALGKSADFHIYPGTNHAFFNDTRQEVYDADAAADAWSRTIRFLRQHLG